MCLCVSAALQKVAAVGFAVLLLCDCVFLSRKSGQGSGSGQGQDQGSG